MDMEPPYFRHKHPLLFIEEHSNGSEAKAANCSMCGEAMILSGPSFSCADCGISLHKKCAEAPSELHHPFHRNHPLTLLPNPTSEYGGRFICDFCGEGGRMFQYHCSCRLDFHIKCALFTYKIAQKNFGELQGIAYKDPSMTITNSTRNGMELEEVGSAKCFGCWERLLDAVYYSLDGGIKVHKKCVELPGEVNHPCHRKHTLLLQFNSEIFPDCIICQDTHRHGFFYCCSPCNFIIHVKCLSPPPSVIEDKLGHHPHPFTPFLREFPFACDACGSESERKCFPHMCSECNLLVHKECISLPRLIKFIWHEHPISHTYFLPRQELSESESQSWDCVVCRDEVDTDYGSYSCLRGCHFIVHVNCVRKHEVWYHAIEKLGGDSVSDEIISLDRDSTTVLERNEDGEATKIKHFGHPHNLMLSDNKVVDEDEEDDHNYKYCDGCTLPVSSSSESDACYYSCSQSQCDFILHKKCAEFPKKLHLWFHLCQQLLTLVPHPDDSIFRCDMCGYICNGFVYQCDKCEARLCLQCVIPDTLRCQAHEHPLSSFIEDEGHCNACGEERSVIGRYKCKGKGCDFALHFTCLTLPLKAPHKCDEHLLTLAYHDDNAYSQTHFCDICEKVRNPTHWFYHCATCNNSAHPKCVVGRYPFIKLGKIYNYKESSHHHQHPLIFVKKIHHDPECFKCGDTCRDLALQCLHSDQCGYIVHWDCIAPSHLREEE